MNILIGVMVETLRALGEAAPFVLVGLLAAGFLHEFLDTTRIVAALGGRDLRAILTATFLGAPLPLCSCGVLPAALSLRKKGASREATIAFLITTPETGVDSIALTYGLLGPFMAVARPLAAIVTGIVAGVLSMREPDAAPEAGGTGPSPEPPYESVSEAGGIVPRAQLSFRKAIRYAFGPLLDDLAFWLLIGFFVSGVVAATLPNDFFPRFLPGGLPSLIAMAILGVPTYVCASASTPVAAAMIAKGLNPGAALVFMLTGPATNASTAAIVARLFGRRFILVYLGAIFGVSIAAGALVNAVIDPAWAPASADWQGDPRWAWLQALAGVGLALLMARSLIRTGLRPGVAEIRGHLTALTSWGRRMDWRSVPWRRALGGAAALAIVGLGLSSVVVIRPGEEGIARVFGRVSPRPLKPGLHAFWPPPVGRVDVVASRAVHTVEIGYGSLPPPSPDPASRGARVAAPASFPATTPGFGGPRTSRIPEGSLFVTGDETLVSVTAVILYEVADPARYVLGVDRPDAVLRAATRAVLVEIVGRTGIDALYSSARGNVEAAVLARVRASPTVAAVGIRPIAFSLLYVHAPDEVHAAFRDVASAAEDRTTLRNKALVEAEGAVRLARGEAARRVVEGESYRVEQTQHARGNAAAFTPLAAEDRRASAVTRNRLYLEAMERVLARVPKLIKPKPGRAPGLELWVTPADGQSAPLPIPSPQ